MLPLFLFLLLLLLPLLLLPLPLLPLPLLLLLLLLPLLPLLLLLLQLPLLPLLRPLLLQPPPGGRRFNYCRHEPWHRQLRPADAILKGVHPPDNYHLPPQKCPPRVYVCVMDHAAAGLPQTCSNSGLLTAVQPKIYYQAFMGGKWRGVGGGVGGREGDVSVRGGDAAHQGKYDAEGVDVRGRGT